MTSDADMLATAVTPGATFFCDRNCELAGSVRGQRIRAYRFRYDDPSRSALPRISVT